MNVVTTFEKPATSTDFFTGPFHLSIGGKLVEAEESFDVINPAT